MFQRNQFDLMFFFCSFSISLMLNWPLLCAKIWRISLCFDLVFHLLSRVVVTIFQGHLNEKFFSLPHIKCLTKSFSDIDSCAIFLVDI